MFNSRDKSPLWAAILCLLNRSGDTALSGMRGQGGVVLRRNARYEDVYNMYGKLEKIEKTVCWGLFQ